MCYIFFIKIKFGVIWYGNELENLRSFYFMII